MIQYVASRTTAAVCRTMGAGLLAVAASLAAAQEYPAKDIRLVVPLSAGSSVDTLARAFAAEMSKDLKQPVVVENRAGGDSVIGTQFTKNAPPDGYTIMLVIPAHAINVHLYPKLPYDPIKDFTLIAMVASNMNMLVVPPNSPFKSVSDLIAHAKSKPGSLNFGNAGGTSGGSAELLNYMAGIKTTNVMYKGAPPALTDLMAGTIDFMFTALSSGTSFVQSDKLRALAVTGPSRHGSLPNIPTVGETIPNYSVLGWYGLVGPAGMPAPIVERLNKSLFTALAAPDVRARLATLGFDPATSNNSAQFESFVRAEIEKWGKVTKPRE